MLNLSLVQGKLTKNPELRETFSGKKVLNFYIESVRDCKNRDGERDSDFVNCTVFGRGAEFVSRKFHAGDYIIVAGRLKQDAWIDPSGKRNSTMLINVSKIYFFGYNGIESVDFDSAKPQREDSIENDILKKAKLKYECFE